MNKKHLKVKWKTELCPVGKKCWCRGIIPILDNMTEDDYIVPEGCLGKKVADYLVKLHNKSIEEE